MYLFKWPILKRRIMQLRSQTYDPSQTSLFWHTYIDIDASFYRTGRVIDTEERL